MPIILSIAQNRSMASFQKIKVHNPVVEYVLLPRVVEYTVDIDGVLIVIAPC